jgi:IS1 family transposase
MVSIMNRLPRDKQVAVVKALVEGNSIRSTVRLTGVAKNTVTKLLVELGGAVAEYQHQTLRNLPTKRVQADEIWSFCYAKVRAVRKDKTILDRNKDAGDVWTWTAIDADSKLCISFLVGPRTADNAHALLADVKARMTQRIQLTTDQLTVYMRSADRVFGIDVDYAMLHKIFAPTGDTGRYSPPVCIGCEKRVMTGDPDPKHISTSYVERLNLSMRMGIRRFTRLTNGFSRKIENHAAAVSLYFMWYNFGRVHQTLRVTPAMEAGIADHVWSAEEIVALLR